LTTNETNYQQEILMGYDRSSS